MKVAPFIEWAPARDQQWTHQENSGKGEGSLPGQTVAKHSPLSTALAPAPLTVPIPSPISTPDPLASKLASGVM